MLSLYRLATSPIAMWPRAIVDASPWHRLHVAGRFKGYVVEAGSLAGRISWVVWQSTDVAAGLSAEWRRAYAGMLKLYVSSGGAWQRVPVTLAPLARGGDSA